MNPQWRLASSLCLLLSLVNNARSESVNPLTLLSLTNVFSLFSPDYRPLISRFLTSP